MITVLRHNSQPETDKRLANTFKVRIVAEGPKGLFYFDARAVSRAILDDPIARESIFLELAHEHYERLANG